MCTINLRILTIILQTILSSNHLSSKNDNKLKYIFNYYYILIDFSKTFQIYQLMIFFFFSYALFIEILLFVILTMKSLWK